MKNSGKLVSIYQSDNSFEIMNLYNVLQEAGITSYKVNCNTNYSYGVVEMELKVNEIDAEKALKIIKQVAVK